MQHIEYYFEFSHLSDDMYAQYALRHFDTNGLVATSGSSSLKLWPPSRYTWALFPTWWLTWTILRPLGWATELEYCFWVAAVVRLLDEDTTGDNRANDSLKLAASWALDGGRLEVRMTSEEPWMWSPDISCAMFCTFSRSVGGRLKWTLATLRPPPRAEPGRCRAKHFSPPPFWTSRVNIMPRSGRGMASHTAPLFINPPPWPGSWSIIMLLSESWPGMPTWTAAICGPKTNFCLPSITWKMMHKHEYIYYQSNHHAYHSNLVYIFQRCLSLWKNKIQKVTIQVIDSISMIYFCKDMY